MARVAKGAAICTLLMVLAATSPPTIAEQSPAADCPPGAGHAALSAHDRGRFPGFFPPELLRAWQPLSPGQLDHPDLNARFIMQLPRYDYDDPVQNSHAPGDAVTFVAHVANRGSQPTGPFAYAWTLDGLPAGSGTAPNLEPGQAATLELVWTWQSGSHVVGLALDPANAIPEVSEANNQIEDRTNGLAVGLWVEQSVYDWFNANQIYLGLGSVSWDDWAQRQMRVWNQMFAEAITPLTPQGILDRVRLDKVVVVPDGALPPCATNFPAPDDKTVDLEWGFPSEEVGVPSGHVCGAFNFYLENPEAANVEYSLMHELSHARYLIDLYGLNVYVNAVRLAAPASSTASILALDRDVENDWNFPTPAPLAVGGEFILCQGKAGSTFTGCERGVEGTVPRAHPAGQLVNLATVRLQDGQGNLVQGSEALPVIGWDDHLYYGHYQDDVMNGGLVYREHSAYAWNRIAGQRPVCGNYNAPCNLGEYLGDLPAANWIEIRTSGGEPVPGVRVELFRAKPFPTIYGKVYVRQPDLIAYSDAAGQANLGSFPFGDGVSSIATYNSTVLLKLSSQGQVAYRFLEVTEANVAYWSGEQELGVYSISADLPPGRPPHWTFLPTLVEAFAPPEQLLSLAFEDGVDGAQGEPGVADGVTFVPGYAGQGILVDNGDSLSYATAGNIRREAGRIEFWLKPSWNGGDGKSYVFFEVGDGWFNRLRIMKDGANNLRFMVWSAEAEYGVAHNVAGWAADEWHSVRVAWSGDAIALTLDGVLVEKATAIVLPESLAATMYVGSTASADQQAQAVIDELAIYSQP
jgi:hypothetical protein